MESPPLAPLSKSVNRLLIMSLILAAWVLLMVGRLFQLQILQHDKYLAMARKQQERLELVPLFAEPFTTPTERCWRPTSFPRLRS